VRCATDGITDVPPSQLEECGKVGFWTKADAAGLFDDLVVQAK
jgi:hypothetical protein